MSDVRKPKLRIPREFVDALAMVPAPTLTARELFDLADGGPVQPARVVTAELVELVWGEMRRSGYNHHLSLVEAVLHAESVALDRIAAEVER